jgi:phosphoserine phosphatase
MTKLTPPHDPIEALGEAYELLLDKTMDEAHKAKIKSGPALHHLIDELAEKSSDVTELAGEETVKIGKYLKRDLIDAATYLQKTGKAMKDWFGFDLALIEDRLRDGFSQAADQTTVELLKLKQEAQAAGYHTGEISGPGTLICDQCGENLHFHKAGHIPPCPKCQGTRYHRVNE